MGWYFSGKPYGAYYHCKKYLRCDLDNNQGHILTCRIGKQFVEPGMESIQSEAIYGRPTYGVPFQHSDKIEIVSTMTALEYERL